MSKDTPKFRRGDRVVLLRESVGFAERAGLDDVKVPVMTVGLVTSVREVEDPRAIPHQGPWLYDVEFPVTVTLPADFPVNATDPLGWVPGGTVLDVCWFIFDARDVADIAPAPAA